MSAVPPPADVVAADVARALAEDVGSGDISADLLPAGRRVRATIRSRENAVLCGAPWAEACFRALDPNVRIEWAVQDSGRLQADGVFVHLVGDARALVTGERSAINFLQVLSGTATATAAYVERVQGTGARILDTRKTLPGLRLAQKYAVRCGGGMNHRIGLFDAVMLKENHIVAAGSIAQAATTARTLHPSAPLICEVESLDELTQAIDAGVDRVLIDDFSLDDMRRAVSIAAGRVPLEVSGGVTLERVREIALTGVDYISVGSLTKHVRAVDLSMRILGDA
ncbi:carboxylating nicotinate-nucleotide diphosphorylase [Chiayiivirga flava]|uniref:Probable nicotinate-nucleotide pyrophosphorylase [carboxylating] n=1 Tax=Chiayiivirga flava TaxID=659595 RepID=A0A7W8D843_9GAMM|nr:carboxylating nicotinate-nucleotide diphosphorylase [Chiayiivirga flava]MBB5209352.1 nicotinate-nucleotide pyrophosphorylase (carboxylating) [Chiayiivirga flava]